MITFFSSLAAMQLPSVTINMILFERGRSWPYSGNMSALTFFFYWSCRPNSQFPNAESLTVCIDIECKEKSPVDINKSPMIINTKNERERERERERKTRRGKFCCYFFRNCTPWQQWVSSILCLFPTFYRSLFLVSHASFVGQCRSSISYRHVIRNVSHEVKHRYSTKCERVRFFRVCRLFFFVPT